MALATRAALSPCSPPLEDVGGGLPGDRLRWGKLCMASISFSKGRCQPWSHDGRDSRMSRYGRCHLSD